MYINERVARKLNRHIILQYQLTVPETRVSAVYELRWINCNFHMNRVVVLLIVYKVDTADIISKN